MARILTILFRRDPSCDRQDERIQYRGFRPYWPDGREVTVGLDAFCKHGQRLLGLNRHLATRQECLIQLIQIPLKSREDDLHRIPGHRVRRFFLQREGPQGRIHFLDGTPTAIVFHSDQDEPEVLRWIGLPYLLEGERLWFDLAACPVENAATRDHKRVMSGKNGVHEMQRIGLVD